MKKIKEESEFFSALLDLLSAQLGSSCELVLYDLTGSAPELVDIRNGQLSGGTAGIYQDLVRVQTGWPFENSREAYNIISTLDNGTLLRCSATCIYDDGGKPIGCICLNQDITKSLEAERLIHNLNQYHGDAGSTFVSGINDVLENLISEASDQIGVPYDEMTKENRIEFIRFLDQRGAFLVTKAGDRICSLLGISKYTMYSYLDIARNIVVQRASTPRK